MKFGDFRSRVPEIGEKVYLRMESGARPQMFASSIIEVMRKFGFEQVQRRDPLVWRTKFQLPEKSWTNLRGQLFDQGQAKVDRVE